MHNRRIKQQKKSEERRQRETMKERESKSILNEREDTKERRKARKGEVTSEKGTKTKQIQRAWFWWYQQTDVWAPALHSCEVEEVWTGLMSETKCLRWGFSKTGVKFTKKINNIYIEKSMLYVFTWHCNQGCFDSIFLYTWHKNYSYHMRSKILFQ